MNQDRNATKDCESSLNREYLTGNGQSTTMMDYFGRVPEWTKGTDCKSVIRGFESHRGLLLGPMCTCQV